jgi:hypothetical protein
VVGRTIGWPRGKDEAPQPTRDTLGVAGAQRGPAACE